MKMIKVMRKSKVKIDPGFTAKRIDIKEAARKAEYREKLNRSIKQLEEGRGQIHELIEVEDD